MEEGIGLELEPDSVNRLSGIVINTGRGIENLGSVLRTADEFRRSGSIQFLMLISSFLLVLNVIKASFGVLTAYRENRRRLHSHRY